MKLMVSLHLISSIKKSERWRSFTAFFCRPPSLTTTSVVVWNGLKCSILRTLGWRFQCLGQNVCASLALMRHLPCFNELDSPKSCCRETGREKREKKKGRDKALFYLEMSHISSDNNCLFFSQKWHTFLFDFIQIQLYPRIPICWLIARQDFS